MTEMRILHVITRLIVGGAQDNTLSTVVGQSRTNGFQVSLVAGIDDGPEGNLHEQARSQNVDLHLMPELVRPIAPWTDCVAVAKLVQLIRRGRYDVVHTHSSKAGIVGRIAARIAGTPIVVHTLHGLVFGEHTSSGRNALYVGLKRFCARLTDRIISVSDATRSGALAARIGRPEQHVTIYSGFPLEPFLEISRRLPMAEAKKRIGFAADDLVAGKVGRLFSQKGHDHFLEAARQIAAQSPRARFLVVGDGILRAALEAKSSELGIRDRVLFTGLVAPTAVPALIQAMDVLVHTSEKEGLARAIPQAMVAGKPVVGFALDGTPEVVAHGVTGYLARPLDPGDVARHVTKLFGDPEKRRSMGSAGRLLATRLFSVENMVSRINQVYLEVAEERLKKALPLPSPARAPRESETVSFEQP